MLFPTLAFGVFFLIVYFTAWSLDRENGKRKLFLLLASWFFYAQWDWRFVGLLIASAILNWGVAALIARDRARRHDGKGGGWLVGLGVAANLLILGFFKYYGFFVEEAGELLARVGWERDLPLLQIVLPVGISFFTFQGISYVVDVKRGKTPPALAVVRDVQRRVAADLGVAFWDWHGRMGGDCSSDRLALGTEPLMRGDRVHFTGAGGDWIGGILAGDLMAAYEAWKAGQGSAD